MHRAFRHDLTGSRRCCPAVSLRDQEASHCSTRVEPPSKQERTPTTRSRTQHASAAAPQVSAASRSRGGWHWPLDVTLRSSVNYASSLVSYVLGAVPGATGATQPLSRHRVASTRPRLCKPVIRASNARPQSARWPGACPLGDMSTRGQGKPIARARLTATIQGVFPGSPETPPDTSVGVPVRQFPTVSLQLTSESGFPEPAPSGSRSGGLRRMWTLPPDGPNPSCARKHEALGIWRGADELLSQHDRRGPTCGPCNCPGFGDAPWNGQDQSPRLQ